MLRVGTILAVCVLISGCGGSTHASSARNGCRGLQTAQHQRHFLVVFGALRHMTPKDLCAQIGAPTKITEKADGTIIWAYRSAVFTFRGNRLVNGVSFNQ